MEKNCENMEFLSDSLETFLLNLQKEEKRKPTHSKSKVRLIIKEKPKMEMDEIYRLIDLTLRTRKSSKAYKTIKKLVIL